MPIPYPRRARPVCTTRRAGVGYLFCLHAQVSYPSNWGVRHEDRSTETEPNLKNQTGISVRNSGEKIVTHYNTTSRPDPALGKSHRHVPEMFDSICRISCGPADAVADPKYPKGIHRVSSIRPI